MGAEFPMNPATSWAVLKGMTDQIARQKFTDECKSRPEEENRGASR
jgi:hypothetical protein